MSKISDSRRRSMIFSLETIQKLTSISFDLLIEWMLREIGVPINANRLAFLRSPNGVEKGDFIFVKGIGPQLPLAGNPIFLPENVRDTLFHEGWSFIPTEGVGWDAVFSFPYKNGERGYILVDDTSGSRDFDEADQEFLEDASKWFGALYDVKVSYEGIKQEAKTDPLTGLPNNHQIVRQLQMSIQKYLTGEVKNLSAAVIDIDFFKQCNDTRGHAFGDHVLITLAKLLKDLPIYTGRYGGEEFLLVSELDIISTQNILEKLLQDYRTIDMSDNDIPYFSTFSCGLFEVSRDFLNTFEDLKIRSNNVFNKADNLMYKAKKTGRNRILLT